MNISVNEVKNLICILSSISRNTLFLQLFCDLILRSKEDGPTTITCCRFLKLRMVWRRFKRRFGGGSRDSLAEVRKTVWRRSRDGLTEAERRFGGGLSDSLAEVRKTAWRRFERQIFFFCGGSRVHFFRRRFERRCGEDLGKSAAKNVRELSEPLRERKSVKKGQNSVTREKVQFGEKKIWLREKKYG